MKILFPALQRVQTEGSCLTFHLPAGLRTVAEPIEIGKYWCVLVSRPRKPRTTGYRSQNHRLNGFISQLCDSTGNDFDDIKLYVKRKAMRRGLPAKIDDKGQILYSLVDGEPLPISETDMDTVQCSWVIEEIQQLSAECGVILREE